MSLLESEVRRMTLKERVQNYNVSYPNRPDLFYDKEFILGFWLIGSMNANTSGYYGSYPFGMAERIDALFPDIEVKLELFSGTMKPAPPRFLTYDIKEENKPTICDNALNITKHQAEFAKVGLVRADPPYEPADFAIYKEKPFSKANVIRQLGEVMIKGSFLAWLDLRYPMWSKKYWRLVGTIGVTVGSNTRVRSWFIWEHV